jgi:hypothetical protein
VAYIAAGLLLVLALLGFLHALRTPATTAFAAPDRVQDREARQPIGA